MNISERANSSSKIDSHSFLLTILLPILTLVLLGGFNQAQGQWTTNGSDINNTNSGKVGVGTSAPSAKLEVQIGNAVADGIKVTDAGTSGKSLYIGDGGSHSGLFSPYIAGIGGNGWGLLLEGGVSSDAANIPAVSVRGNIGYSNLANSPIFTVAKSTGTELFRIGATGNVGIGTATPGGRLQVAGDAYVGSNDGTIPYAVSIGASGNGYGGIGYGFKFSPTSNTHTYSANDYASLLQFQSGGFRFRTAPVGATGNNVSFTEIITGLNNGNVGIGTNTPTVKLDVNGTANVNGNLTVTNTISGGTIEARYQDVAEWVPATRALAAGTVVTLDPTRSNQVTASSIAYDTRVAGVISERPGLALGEAGKDKVLVATTGRVKVKVDATRSPIKIGDLLVTSDKEGLAMKSEPLMIQGRPFHSPGTLVGKALEPLEKGTGEILVLLSLQ